MRRAFLFALATTLLQAQIWQDPQTLVRYHDRDILSPRATFRFERSPRGETLPLPPSLDPFGIGSWDHHRGITYALGTLRHPAHDALEQRRQRDLMPTGLGAQTPLLLCASLDFRTWEPLGRTRRDFHGSPRALRPLDDGTFLAIGKLFWDGDAISPFARYRLDADGILRFERLVEPGFGEPLFTPFDYPPQSEEGRKWKRGARISPRYPELAEALWKSFRTPSALILADRASGWLLLLDPRDGRVRARFHPYPEALARLQKRPRWPLLLGAHPAPDGRLFLAFRQPELLQHDDPMTLYLREEQLPNASSRQAYQLLKRMDLRRSLYATTEATPRFPEIRWFSLDPARVRLDAVPAPPGAPSRISNVWDSLRLRFEVRPDGTVATVSADPRPGIGSLYRLLFW